MLKQKEFAVIVNDFKNNNMKGYQEWFDKNVNCEVSDKTNNSWRKGIQLYSESQKYAIIVIEGFEGIAMRVVPNMVRVIEK